ncbi:hypothetical protein M885DRAFT_503712 [Pelagophyceae sp. CCMP2097]|nr:hypothetical protein M885DRAFT_503712 [Pelagophyceae sp. CCMP2097]
MVRGLFSGVVHGRRRGPELAFWGHFGAILGPFPGHFGAVPGPFWGRSRAVLGHRLCGPARPAKGMWQRTAFPRQLPRVSCPQNVAARFLPKA